MVPGKMQFVVVSGHRCRRSVLCVFVVGWWVEQTEYRFGRCCVAASASASASAAAAAAAGISNVSVPALGKKRSNFFDSRGGYRATRRTPAFA